MKTMILTVVLASIAELMYCSDASLAVTQEAEDKELRVLLEARRDTLREAVRFTKSRCENGIMSIADLSKANISLLDAELELAKNQQERIEIFEKTLEVQIHVESVVKAMVMASEGSTDQLLIATADRMKAEIDLYRAKEGK